MTNEEKQAARMRGQIASIGAAVRTLVMYEAIRQPHVQDWLENMKKDCLIGAADAERSGGLTEETEIFGEAVVQHVAFLFSPLPEGSYHTPLFRRIVEMPVEWLLKKFGQK